MPRTSSGILLLRKEERSITCDNWNLSLQTQHKRYQTHSVHPNQAFARILDLSNTPIAIIILKLQKQGCPCSLSAISQSLQAFLSKPVPLPSLQHMQAIHKLRHDL